MTSRTNARVAGSAFLFYIVVSVGTMIVAGGIPAADGVAERIEVLGQHATVVRINMLLGVLTGFTALTLGAALYGFTRQEDPDLAALALACRVVEGALVVVPTVATLSLLTLAENEAGAHESSIAIGALLWKVKAWNVTVAATFFAVGSTLFSWLLLRGRLVPVRLAQLGVIASLLLVVTLPLQLAEMVRSPFTWIVWIPMAVFEVVLGGWLLWKGGGQHDGAWHSPGLGQPLVRAQ